MQFRHNDFRIFSSVKRENLIIEIMQAGGLPENYNEEVAKSLNHHEHDRFHWQQVRILIQDSSVMLESGALQYMIGNIEMENRTGGVGGFAKKFVGSAVTGETANKPIYRGSGEIYLEPKRKDFTLIELAAGEEVIVDDGLFYCAENKVKVGVAKQGNVSTALFGGEGLFQTKITASENCYVVLELPVPEYELVRYELDGSETLKVDGSFAVLRSSTVEFTVEKSTKSLVGSATSGEGMLQTFRGRGEVWLAPTLPIRPKTF
ncbi:AIM24 family protein [Saccharibacillus sp. CPCC 101409]|uniref:AIM24 family protein n=1 Tax=Saccharibacillus sp. CPCC 101409 TaxID=3058041 RepID=UPI002673AB92|nr:AIM24 family protein [Saccharibacillus sp. CPCC 101409]MDO3413099.1 AIM24 family protein [Saccharibacillus sp. CPCC 101409]